MNLNLRLRCPCICKIVVRRPNWNTCTYWARPNRLFFSPSYRAVANKAISQEPSSADSSKPKRDVWRWEESDDARRTYGVFLAILLLGAQPLFQTGRTGDLFYFISLAVTTIYIGAHKGLNAKHRQSINLKEGFIAPVAASAVIFCTYLVLKYFPDFSLQSILDIYFWVLANFAIIGALRGPVKVYGETFSAPKVDILVPEVLQLEEEGGKPVKSICLRATDAVVLIIALTVSSIDLVSHHGNFTMNNAIACLIAADVMQFLGLNSFRVAAVLLFGMLLYDVTWVFASPQAIGENVMLKVATSDIMNGPTRLLFPKIPGSVGEAASFPFSLLGLGDIAIPGLFACLALRYDASRTIDMRSRGIAAAEAIQGAIESLSDNASGDEIAELTGRAAEEAYDRIANLELEQQDRSQGISMEQGTVVQVSDAVMYHRNYFVAVVIAYVLGLSAAFAANSITGLGQPALLYLVPSVVFSTILLAISRNEFSRLWSYRETGKSDN
eukprot:jgi/Picsp_1/6800/NSC_04139-R1_protein